MTKEDKKPVSFQVPDKDYLDGLYLAVPDYDKEFRSLDVPPRIINDYPTATKEDKQALNALLVTEYKGDTLDTVPYCDCRREKEGKNLGKICSYCNSPVSFATEKPIQPAFWMQCPEGSSGFILPAFWAILTANFSTKQTCIISWLINTRYTPTARNPKIIDRLMALNIKRGLNNFIDNFDEIIDLLIEKRFFKSKCEHKIHCFKEYIRENRNKLFPKVLPLPPSLNFIKESTPTGTYTDETIKHALDAVWSMCSLYEPGKAPAQDKVERNTFKVVTCLATYYSKLWSKSLTGKPGLLRKHVFGGRPDWSFRSVITSIHGVHDHRELHVPWALAVSLFKEHIMSILLRRNHTFNSAAKYIANYTLKYSSELHEILNSIIHEPVEEIQPNSVCIKPIQPVSGASVLFQRNPSLLRLSAQNLFITRIKTDMTDFTISLSNIVLKGYNADFDGDQLNGMLMLDREQKKAALRCAPHLGLIAAGKIRETSGNVVLPKPALSTINNFLVHKA